MASFVSNDYRPFPLFEDLSPVYGSPRPHPDPAIAATLVKAHQFTDVIVLLGDRHDRGADFKNAYEQAGMNAFHYPINEPTPPSCEQLNVWIPAILNLAHTKDRKILIHCQGGIGRTGTIGACAFAALYKTTADQAIDAIRKRRPGAIDFPELEKCVRDYAARVNGSAT